MFRLLSQLYFKKRRSDNSLLQVCFDVVLKLIVHIETQIHSFSIR